MIASMITINYISKRHVETINYHEYDFKQFVFLDRHKNVAEYNLFFNNKNIEYLAYEKTEREERFTIYLVYKICEYRTEHKTKNIFLKKLYPSGEEQMLPPDDKQFLNVLSMFKRRGLI